jgi:hypothetical protein
MCSTQVRTLELPQVGKSRKRSFSRSPRATRLLCENRRLKEELLMWQEELAFQQHAHTHTHKESQAAKLDV